MPVLEKWFKLKENGTTVGTEVRGGLVTFLTMSYIIFFQPALLMQTGLSFHTVFIATCVSSAVATVLMAFFANYPIALAPAMGHNVLFLILCKNGTVNWQTGLGAIFISGTIFIVLSFWGIREKIVTAIPSSIKHAIAVGIGLLIAFIGFQWAGLAVDERNTLVQLGDLSLAPVLLALGGVVFTSALIALNFRGAILLGILVTAAVGIPLGITSTEKVETGVLSMPAPAPAQRVAVLPFADRDDNAAVIAQALDGAIAAKCKDHTLVPARAAAKDVRAAGFVPDSKYPYSQAQLAELHRFGRETLGCDIIVFPWLETPEDGPRELHVTCFNAADKEANEPFRQYVPLALPTDPDERSARLRRYLNDVALGLPGHSGLLRLDVLGALKLGLLHVIFIFFFLDLFDTIGTLIGVSQQAGFLRQGKLPRARGALLADAFGTVVGAGLGTSTVTSYIESSAGVQEGARTGLANLVTAALFLLALFFTPVVEMIGGRQAGFYPALAPVLIIIGSIMMRNVVQITWTDPTEALPAFLAIMLMPLTFSITDGIAFGFISYAFLKLITGRGREVHWLVYLFAALFVARYVCKACLGV